MEALWGARPPADPDANLATPVSRLRAVLGPEVIAGDRHGWRSRRLVPEPGVQGGRRLNDPAAVLAAQAGVVGDQAGR